VKFLYLPSFLSTILGTKSHFFISSFHTLDIVVFGFLDAVGASSFMAPEVAIEKRSLTRPSKDKQTARYGSSADIFPLGLTLWFLFTCDQTIVAIPLKEKYEIMDRKIEEVKEQELSRQLFALLRECLSESPRLRPTAQEVIVRLKKRLLLFLVSYLNNKERAFRKSKTGSLVFTTFFIIGA